VYARDRLEAEILRRFHRAEVLVLHAGSTWSARDGISKHGLSWPSMSSQRPWCSGDRPSRSSAFVVLRRLIRLNTVLRRGETENGRKAKRGSIWPKTLTEIRLFNAALMRVEAHVIHVGAELAWRYTAPAHERMAKARGLAEAQGLGDR
jgi:hypothetical protein